MACFARILILMVALTVNAAAAGIDMGRVADQLAQVETAGRDGAIGRGGERGRYQLSLPVWLQHRGSQPFELAHDAAISRQVTIEHLAWLVTRLELAGAPVTVFNLALAWNAGSAAVARGRTLSRQRDYAQRVANLYFAG